MSQNLLCNVPFIIEAEDYHDFDMFDRAFRQLCSKLRCVEIDFDMFDRGGSTYLGLVYVAGSKPTPKRIKQLVEEAGGEYDPC